jgi:hypothetical protein
MRTITLSLIWIALVASSCKEVSFSVPQPAGIPALKEVPTALQGKYQAKDQPKDEKKDTLIIESWGYHFKDRAEKDWLGRGVLNDTLVLKYYQNYYFVNFKSGSQWVLRLVKQLDNGDIEFLSVDIQDDAKRKEMIRKLSRKFTLKEVKNGDDTYYQINPTPAQLMQLIKEGYFTGQALTRKK